MQEGDVHVSSHIVHVTHIGQFVQEDGPEARA